MPSLLVALLFVVVLAVFAAAAARRVVLNLGFGAGAIVLRLVVIWLVVMALHSLISLVPPLFTYDGHCAQPGGALASCGLPAYVVQRFDQSLVTHLLFFGLFLIATLAGAATGLIARHRRMAPKGKRR